MKQSSILLLYGLILLNLSCQTNNEEQETSKQLKIANASMVIPEDFELRKGEKMELYSIITPEKQTIKIYNFGKKPISIKSNIARWESQLDTVYDTKTSFYKNNLITLCEIYGVRNKIPVSVLSAIIPTENGPYYLKTTDSIANSQINVRFKKLVTSILYVQEE